MNCCKTENELPVAESEDIFVTWKLLTLEAIFINTANVVYGH